MFHDIPDGVRTRMAELEGIDRRDRQDGTERLRRIRQIGPETGRFLALLAASAPAGEWIKIGASAGSSALWLSLACREGGRRLTTFEVLPEKARLVREIFKTAGIDDVVYLVEGDARRHVPDIGGVSFCFLDGEKDIYADCYEAVVPNMVPDGILAADNAINHRAALQPMLDQNDGET